MFSNGLGFDLPSINSNKEPSPGMFLFSAAQQIFKSPSKEKSSSFSLCFKKSRYAKQPKFVFVF